MPAPRQPGRHVAFVHTSPAHVATFDRLVKVADPSARVDHVVAETLLAEARRLGVDHPALVRQVQQTMFQAAGDGATVVACTCSTIGGIAERTPPRAGQRFARIDRAMADRAVRQGPRVLVVAALRSTLQPTARLIAESAVALGSPATLDTLCVDDAWPHFERGDHDAYIAAIVAAVRAAPRAADVVVLAQASMADAADALGDLGVDVLSSPALGVQAMLLMN